MRNRNCLFAVLIAVLIVAVSLSCSPYTIKSDFDSEANYAGYHSFAMHDQSNLKTQAPLVYKRVERAIMTEMKAKGYQEAASNQADVLIAVHGSKITKAEVTVIEYTYRMSVNDIYEYEEGTLVIDIVDKRADELVWRGTATGVLHDKPGQDDQKVAKVVGKILGKYPPKS